MLKIYHVPFSRSVRLIWLCEALNLRYQKITIDFSAKYRRSAEWRALNPVGKVPVLEDGDITIFESGAIMQYILEIYGCGRLQPKIGTESHAKFLQWIWFSEATHSRPLGEIANHLRVFPKPEQNHKVLQEMEERVMLCNLALENELATKDFICGDDFTAADIMIGYSLLLTERLTSLKLLPNLQTYRNRLVHMPGYKISVEETIPPSDKKP